MNKFKSLIAVSIAATAFFVIACGDNSSSGPAPESSSAESSSSIDDDNDTSSSSSAKKTSSNGEAKSSAKGKSSSSNGTGSSSSIESATDSSDSNQNSNYKDDGILRCYETSRNNVTTPIRCDDGQYFANKQEFVKFFRGQTKNNPDFKSNCHDAGTLCYDIPKQNTDLGGGWESGGCVDDVSCPAKYEDSSSSSNGSGSSSSIGSADVNEGEGTINGDTIVFVDPEIIDCDGCYSGFEKLTAADSSVFAKANELSDSTFVNPTLVSKQLVVGWIVAGWNYKFMCELEVSKTETKKVVLTVYEKLNGEVEIGKVEEAEQTAGVKCYEHDYYDPEITCIVRCDIRTFYCDDEKTFKNELEFGKFVLNERKTDPSFASNCGDFEIRCLDDNQDADNYGGGCDLIGLTCPATSEPITSP